MRVCVCVCLMVFLRVCFGAVRGRNLNLVHNLVPWWHQTLMSSSPPPRSDLDLQLSHTICVSTARDSGRPCYSSPSPAPCGSHRYTPLYLVCLSERLLFELREGQRCKDMNREHNTVCQNRNESKNMCISGNDASLSAKGFQQIELYQVICYCYRWQVHMNPVPPKWGVERCERMIGPRMKSFRVLKGGQELQNPVQLS